MNNMIGEKEYEKICFMLRKFSNNELYNYENMIFKNANLYNKVVFEYKRLLKCSLNSKDTNSDYYKELVQIGKIIKTNRTHTKILREAALKIVSLQLIIGQSIRLYSVLNELKEIYEFYKYNIKYNIKSKIK